MSKNNDNELLGLVRQIAQDSSDTNKSVTSLDKKVDLHIQKTEYELARINDQDAVQNVLLDKHIEGVNTLRLIHEEYKKVTDSRLESLEKPRVWMGMSFKVFLTIGACASAIAGILKLLHMI